MHPETVVTWTRGHFNQVVFAVIYIVEFLRMFYGCPLGSWSDPFNPEYDMVSEVGW